MNAVARELVGALLVIVMILAAAKAAMILSGFYLDWREARRVRRILRRHEALISAIQQGIRTLNEVRNIEGRDQ